jgi:hypothetical protein
MNAKHLGLDPKSSATLPRSQVRVAVLVVLTLLFALRVLGQAIQRWWPQRFLPDFAAFQGSNLSYPILLSAQLVILAVMIECCRRIASGRWALRSAILSRLRWFGRLYLFGSILRLLIGIGVATAPHWFRAWISAGFHVVLALFVLRLAAACDSSPAMTLPITAVSRR